MKTLTLGLGLGLTVAMGLFGIGCSADAEEEAPPAEEVVTRIASSLERKLAVPMTAPTTLIGASIDALLEGHTDLVAREPIVNLGANGKRCTIARFDDAAGAEQMRREQCDGGADSLRIGKVIYKDQNRDAKIDQISDLTAGSYDVFDDDRDGKLDRVVESAERITTPVSLTDFAERVEIMGNGTIASRAREDRDHDGKLDVESVTATTSFRVVTPAPVAPADEQKKN